MIGGSDSLIKIRKLCALGLSSDHLVPRLLQVLHDYIESTSSLFVWVDEKRKPETIYCDDPISYDLVPLIYELLASGKFSDVFMRTEESLTIRHTIDMDSLIRVDRADFLKTPYYQEVFVPMRVEKGLHRPIYCGGRPVGMLRLLRSNQDALFSNLEFAEVDRVARHIEYAFEMAGFDKLTYSVEASRVDILTFSCDARLLHYSEGAQQSLMLSQGVGDVSSLASGKATHDVWALVKRLVKQTIVFSESGKAQTPIFHFKSRWGLYRLTGFLMRPFESISGSSRVVIKIEQFLPAQLAISNELDRFDLTERQFDVAVLIGLNKSYDEIAQTLGVAKSTVISHKKELFKRLNISQRSELKSRLSRFH